MKNMHCLLMGILLLATSEIALGQVTDVVVETNGARLVWMAWPGNPYRVFATPDLVEPAWSNLAPDGLTFTNQQGTFGLSSGAFYCAVASDYVIVDLAEGPTATNYPVSYTNEPPKGGWTDEFKTTKLVLRRTPGGNYTMGSSTNELGRTANEPQHAVKLTKDFYVGVFEVTQRQWYQVMGTWPSYFTNASYRETRPVERVNYYDIRGTVAGTNWPADGNVDTNSFMGLLRSKTGQAYDLPTEVQWERACRAGTTNALNSGKDLTTIIGNCPNMDVVGRYWHNGGSNYNANGDASVGSAKVGSYQPNAWGLYDMHGNVWEWCLDWYETAPAEALDSPGPALGSARVLLGGGWSPKSMYCRSAYRGHFNPGYRNAGYGFRVSLSLGRLDEP